MASCSVVAWDQNEVKLRQRVIHAPSRRQLPEKRCSTRTPTHGVGAEAEVPVDLSGVLGSTEEDGV